MNLSAKGLFAAKWTVAIEDEFIAGLEARRPELVGRVARRREFMRAAVPEWGCAELLERSQLFSKAQRLREVAELI